MKYLISVVAGGGNWNKEIGNKEEAIQEGKRLARLPENLGVQVYEVCDGEIGMMIGNYYVGNF